MTADEDETQIVFNVGMDTTPVELARVGLTAAGTTPAPASTQSVDGKPERVGPPAGILNRPIRAARGKSLRAVSAAVLTAEILARIEEGAFTGDEASVLLGTELQNALRATMDVTRNRWSRRRYQEHFYSFRALPQPWPTIHDTTVVDLGCGALNPYGVAFLFLLLGARRGIAIDLDEILDLPKAVRALADLTAMMLIDPTGIVADFPITRAEMLRNVASFDLPSLERGEVEGIDPDRLTYARESVNALPLASGEADFVFSNAMLEHLDRPETAIAEMARVTRPGGVGVHIVDASDHRSYADPAHHPLKFLTESSETPLLYGSNRIRPREFLPMFESHGFEVLSFEPFRHVDLTGDTLKQLAHPWSGMSPDTLGELDGRICVRRRR